MIVPWHAVLYSGPDCDCLRAKTVTSLCMTNVGIKLPQSQHLCSFEISMVRKSATPITFCKHAMPWVIADIAQTTTTEEGGQHSAFSFSRKLTGRISIVTIYMQFLISLLCSPRMGGRGRKGVR